MTIVNRVPVLACVWCCLTGAVPLAQAPADAPGEDAPTAGPSSVLHVDDVADQIVHVNTRVRHTTVIQLPPTEQILDFVVGDSEYWFVSGSANLAFVKLIAEGVTTNVALICESGTIYSFLVTERNRPPHLVVCIGAADNVPVGAHVPAFVARSRVADFQAMADESRAAVHAIQAEAEAQIIDAQQTATAQIAALGWPDREAEWIALVALRGGPRNSDSLLRWDPDPGKGVWHATEETELSC